MADTSSGRIRVMHLLTDMNIGGAGKLIYYLACAGNREKYEYSAVLPSGSAAAGMLKQAGITVFELPGFDKSYAPKVLRSLTAVIRSQKPDICHTHASLTGRIAAKRAGVKTVIMTRHSSSLPPRAARRFPGRLLCRLHWAIYLTSAIATDDLSREALLMYGVPKRRITAVYNGALPLRDADSSEKNRLLELLCIPRDAFVAGIFARLEEEKCQTDLLRAAALCIRQIPDIYFIIVGDGSCRKGLEELSERYGVSGHVRFCGFVEDIAPYMAICSVNINCSSAVETTNLALIEGMSAGKPSIVTDVGSNAAVVGESGRVIPVGEPPALCDELLRLLRDPGLLGYMSDEARRQYAHFYTAERMAQQTEAVYEASLKENSRR